MHIQFKQWRCHVYRAFYYNGNTALVLLDSTTHERVTVATVNLDGYPLGDNEVLIKDWSENNGLLDALIAAKVVEYTGTDCNTGFEAANLCRVIAEIPPI